MPTFTALDPRVKTVLLNGKVQNYVLFADTDKGYTISYDVEGYAGGPEIERKTEYGNVEVILYEET